MFLIIFFFRWDFIEKLHSLQTSEGLHAANKIRNSHIEWKKQKMKVALAAQTLSASTADSLDFCREQLKLTDFEGSYPTSKFIRQIDSLFDVMNSRNMFAKGYKSAMKDANQTEWKELFSTSLKSLSEISDESGRKLIHSKRKTGFLGLIINIHSFTFLFETLVESKKLNYLLTYKASQDHVELFFCAIRSRLGANNNPTSAEFKSAYKRLLTHHKIKGNRGNSIVQDDTSILQSPQEKKCSTAKTSESEISFEKKYSLLFKNEEHDYSLISHLPQLSEFQTAVLEYIAGFTLKMVIKLLKCCTCAFAVLEPSDNSNFKLVSLKDRGGLIHVNDSVKVVCEMAELTIQKMIKISGGKLPFEKEISTTLSSSVLKNVLEKHY
jgi:hypothetical protein